MGTQTKTICSDRGSVLAELAIIIPVLIIIIAGISDFGSYISRMYWLDHTAYHVTNVGISSLPSERMLRMGNFGNNLSRYHKVSLHRGDGTSFSITPKEDEAKNELSTKTHVDGVSIFTRKSIPVDRVKNAAPLIPALEPDNELGAFKNPKPSDFRNCCGQKGTALTCLDGNNIYADCSGSNPEMTIEPRQ